MLVDRCSRVGGGGVEGQGGAEFFGQRQFLLVDVDGDHVGGTGCAGEVDDAQADTASRYHRNILTGLYGGDVVYKTVSGKNAAS